MIFLCRILARIHSSRQWQKKKKEQNERKQKRKTYIFSDTHHLLLFHVTILHLYHGSSASRGEGLESFSNRKERDKFATIEHISLLYTSLSSFSSVFALAFYVNSYCPGWCTYIIHYYQNFHLQRPFSPATKESDTLEPDFVLPSFVSSFLFNSLVSQESNAYRR